MKFKKARQCVFSSISSSRLIHLRPYNAYIQDSSRRASRITDYYCSSNGKCYCGWRKAMAYSTTDSSRAARWTSSNGGHSMHSGRLMTPKDWVKEAEIVPLVLSSSSPKQCCQRRSWFLGDRCWDRIAPESRYQLDGYESSHNRLDVRKRDLCYYLARAQRSNKAFWIHNLKPSKLD